MIDTFLDFLLLSLASFRLTRLLVYDKITAFIRKPFFEEEEGVDENGEVELYIVPRKKGLRGFIGQLLNCYWCTGVWMAIFLVGLYYLVPHWSEPLIVILAVAGLAAILETIIQQFLQE